MTPKPSLNRPTIDKVKCSSIPMLLSLKAYQSNKLSVNLATVSLEVKITATITSKETAIFINSILKINILEKKKAR